MNDIYNDNSYRVNISRHHYDLKAHQQNIEKKIEEDEKIMEAKLLAEKEYERLDTNIQDKKKKDLDKNLFIARKINIVTTKAKKDAKNLYDNQFKKNELERLHNS